MITVIHGGATSVRRDPRRFPYVSSDATTTCMVAISPARNLVTCPRIHSW